MANIVRVTIDYNVIMAWAQRRNGRPSTTIGDERPWPLFLQFGAPGAGVEEISWDRFFAEFEQADLAFVFRDAAGNGKLDDYHVFISRSAVPELTISPTVSMCVS
jgi:hypothetical protein